MRFQRIVISSYLLYNAAARPFSERYGFPLRKGVHVSNTISNSSTITGTCTVQHTCNIRGGSTKVVELEENEDKDGSSEEEKFQEEDEKTSSEKKKNKKRKSFFKRQGKEDTSSNVEIAGEDDDKKDPSQSDEGQQNESTSSLMNDSDSNTSGSEGKEESTPVSSTNSEKKTFGFFNQRSRTPQSTSSSMVDDPEREDDTDNESKEDFSLDEDESSPETKDSEVSPPAIYKVEKKKFGFFGRGPSSVQATTPSTSEDDSEKDDDITNVMSEGNDEINKNDGEEESSNPEMIVVKKKFGFFGRSRKIEAKQQQLNDDKDPEEIVVSSKEEEEESSHTGDKQLIDESAENMISPNDNSEGASDDDRQDGGDDDIKRAKEEPTIADEAKTEKRFMFFTRRQKPNIQKDGTDEIAIDESEEPDYFKENETIENDADADVDYSEADTGAVDVDEEKVEESSPLETDIREDEIPVDTATTGDASDDMKKSGAVSDDESQKIEKDEDASFLRYLDSLEKSPSNNEETTEESNQQEEKRAGTRTRRFFSFGLRDKNRPETVEGGEPTLPVEKETEEEKTGGESAGDEIIAVEQKDSTIEEQNIQPEEKKKDQVTEEEDKIPADEGGETTGKHLEDKTEMTLEELIHEVLKSQGGEENDRSESKRTNSSSLKESDTNKKSERNNGEEESNGSEDGGKDTPVKESKKARKSKKKRKPGHFRPSRALHNALPWMNSEEDGDTRKESPSQTKPTVDPPVSPNSRQQQAVPMGVPFSPYGPPATPIIIPTSSLFGPQRMVPGIPPPPRRTDATISSLAASLIPLLSRLAVLTLLSSSALFGHGEAPIFSPKPSQHFMLERMNDRYERDGLAMKRALEHPPQKRPKGLWTIMQNGRRSALKKSFAKTAEDNGGSPSASKSIDLYSRTVIVMDVQTMKNDIEKVVEELRDAVSFILRQYDDKATRLDMGTELEIVICIESPGGVVQDYGLAADQLTRIKEAGKERNDILLTVCVDKVAASGGYLMACQANPGQLFAAPYAVVGSIGVLRETINVHDVLEKYGIRPLLLKAGHAKAPLTATNEVTDENLKVVQRNLEKVHDAFRETVSTARGEAISDYYDEVTSGDVFLGKDAASIGLVDSVKTSDEYISERIKAGDRVLRLHKYDKSRMALRLSPLDLLLLKSDSPLGRYLGNALHTFFRIGSQFIKVGGMVGTIKMLDETYQAANRRRLQDDI